MNQKQPYLLLNGLYEELSVWIKRSEFGQLKVPHIVLDLGCFRTEIDEVVRNLQDSAAEDDEGELLESEWLWLKFLKFNFLRFGSSVDSSSDS